MHVLNSPLPFPVPAEPQLAVAELSHWSHFRLDFVIAGLDNCGTTSLGRWLQQLDDIEFSRLGEEDDFFLRTTGCCRFCRKWRGSTRNGRATGP